MTLDSECDIEVWPAEPIALDRTEPPLVSILSTALDDVRLHALEMLRSEVGGILLGDMTIAANRAHISALSALRAEAVEAGHSFVRFTHTTWALLRESRRRRHPGLAVVGWYHSHPGFGVFLSGLDREFHLQLFGATAWQIALVVDPSDGNSGMFWCGPNGPVRCSDVVVESA